MKEKAQKIPSNPSRQTVGKQTLMLEAHGSLTTKSARGSTLLTCRLDPAHWHVFREAPQALAGVDIWASWSWFWYPNCFFQSLCLFIPHNYFPPWLLTRVSVSYTWKQSQVPGSSVRWEGLFALGFLTGAHLSLMVKGLEELRTWFCRHRVW